MAITAQAGDLGFAADERRYRVECEEYERLNPGVPSMHILLEVLTHCTAVEAWVPQLLLLLLFSPDPNANLQAITGQVLCRRLVD